MTDHLSPEKRSQNMRLIKSKDTVPEKKVRSVAHRLGLRFRLHRNDLPGAPDILFPRRRTALFVHGCFWHRHKGCPRATIPKTNNDYWSKKFMRNVERDNRDREKLEEKGWKVLVVWECETKSEEAIESFFAKHFKL